MDLFKFVKMLLQLCAEVGQAGNAKARLDDVLIFTSSEFAVLTQNIREGQSEVYLRGALLRGLILALEWEITMHADNTHY
jgi:hypothetical protein